ncbi:MAG: HAD-IC family P-type ATPase [Candidatus Bathyarchaeia archaeon]|jgi:Ca2+-transporting ATPase
MKRNVIFVRVSPEQKLRVVSVLKKSGQIVAVTGDGVNDAPSLKEANVGEVIGCIWQPTQHQRMSLYR